MSPRDIWPVARVVLGAGVLAVVVWRLGTGPILAGLRTVNVWSLAAAAAIALATTVASAWRWSLVARGLGVPIPLRTAVAAYYRSQFLNTTLPGGVLGDVHRGVRHGRDSGEIGRSLRAVAWERTAGQAVQVVLALVVLLAIPSPVRSWLWLAVPVAVALALAVALAMGLMPSRWSGILGADLRAGIFSRPAWPGITAASVLVVAGHATTFLIAARTAGPAASTERLLPLAMLALLAMTVPVSIGGWGPREGATAWLFGVAGLGAGQGLATATVYGVLVFVACLPGAAVLLIARRRSDPPQDRAGEARIEPPVHRAQRVSS
jgi:uncharacterized membrane protein YbhN (UPF0104 family)